jgi:cyclophilin family peptidyl-prolyl cis-trans isomerase
MKGQITLEKGNVVVELELFDDVAPNTVANLKN